MRMYNFQDSMRKKIAIVIELSILLLFSNCFVYSPETILYYDSQSKNEKKRKEEGKRNSCLLYILVKTDCINSQNKSLSEYDRNIKCGINNYSDYYVSPCTAPVNSF